MTIRGECFCGAVGYAIDGPLRDARSCHCSRCRKAFSAQASSYAEVDAANFRWERGEPLLTTFANKDGSGLQFCSRCGSTLCGIVNGQVHGITLGCLNDDPGIGIGQHIFVGSRAAWEIIPDGVLQYEGAPPMPDSADRD